MQGFEALFRIDRGGDFSRGIHAQSPGQNRGTFHAGLLISTQIGLRAMQHGLRELTV